MSRQRRERKVQSGDTQTRRRRLLWLIPCVLGLALHLRTVAFDFIFDDRPLIIENHQIQSWNYLPVLLTTHLWSHQSKESPIPQYRPMFSVWLLIIYSIVGALAWPWHLVSVLLHGLATYLVYRLCRELLGSPYPAGAAAVLFSIHPIHIEPVSWIASSNELLYTNFVLSSLITFYLGFNGKETDKLSPYYKTLSVALWTAAIFTKESALPVIVAFFYLAYAKLDFQLPWTEKMTRAARVTMPYLTSVMLYLGSRFLVIGRIGLERGEHTWLQVVYSAPSVCFFYLEKLVLPFGLSPFYLNQVLSSPQVQFWITTGLLILLLTILSWLSFRRWSSSLIIGFASLLLFLPMLPVLIGIRNFFNGELTHDRYLYLPSVGLSLFAGFIAWKLFTFSKWSKILTLSVGSLVFLFSIWLTSSQERFYANDEKYFRRGIEIAPENVRVIDYLGEFYAGSGRTKEALQEFNRAHDMKPDDPGTAFHLAVALFNDKQFATAEPYLEELSRQKDDAQGRHKVVLFALGETEISLNHFLRAESVLKQLGTEDDTYPGLHGSIGSLYVLMGRIPDGQREFTREVEISGDPSARQNAAYLGAVMRGEAPPPPAASRPSMQSSP